ncbi:chorismate synthase [Natronobacterium gregoryi]|uniref:Chorismate synthase n=2 Tax=Natronobacterium gregoryi TaxID=44930 RepID=L0AP09_NATGS|nr:chorismate synthase [Natronobacterium gregoryi]AFZ74825.1 chorismate synthase [Natronobacterium gregoryi SP2]ELY66158.1 chorismate synthase [Natronobacterium gregoryi SP2]PLK19469.1 chorismate synthase [Natronobacterium gregoryi SP2]SFJ43805.1 chorismate synthase [Natronobacterium gregoryi]
MNGNRFGRLFQVTTFGESHGEAMGCTVSGCPAGLELSEEDIQADLDRRKPGQSMITTSRGEPDDVSIKSGIQDGYTTGTPIGMVIQNKDARSEKYEPFITAPRPSHGDFTYSAKFGTRNWGGGGRSSARETVNWVAAGAIAKQLLAHAGIELKAHVNQIDDIAAPEVSFEQLNEHSEANDVRCAHPETAERMQARIEEYQQEGDSIGGSIYFEARGAPPGLGAPRFDSLSARLGQAMMSVPATTAFEFGLGREAREYTGSERNDDWEFDSEGNPTPVENDHGGIQGGISSGEPIYGEVTLHAPTSIPKSQQTADWETGELKDEQVIGRHDPVLPPRGVPVVEAMLALTLVDFMLLSGRINPDRLDDRPGEYDTDYHPSNPRNE